MSPSITIRPCDLRIVQDILRTVLPEGAKIWVFGSRAKGTSRKASDLDLVIDCLRPLSRDEEFALAEAFEESDLPYTVDVVDWHTISNTFRAMIVHDRVALSTRTMNNE